MNRVELRSIRERYGYSLRKVAQAAEMSHPYLQQLENGTKPLNRELQARNDAEQEIKRLKQEATTNAAS